MDNNSQESQKDMTTTVSKTQSKNDPLAQTQTFKHRPSIKNHTESASPAKANPNFYQTNYKGYPDSKADKLKIEKSMQLETFLKV